ncbi:MAG: pyridoxal-phosphate dependent enzyme, partial [Symbiobacteriaceae bacterium]|nr:pyridoxal-phosphate dependent enzyme [Symbiobacteriaceae bacterium]
SERIQRAMEIAQERNMVMVHAYDDAAVIAGQGTIGLEILEQLPEVEQVVVQIGGGGLCAGVATALRGSGYRGRIVGVEPEVCPRMAYAFAQGKPDPLPTWQASVGDGISSNKAGNLTYPLIKEYIDELVTVSEEEILQATVLLIEQGKLFVEPSGAATYAAALAGKLQPDLVTVCLISGGNTDLASLARLLS